MDNKLLFVFLWASLLLAGCSKSATQASITPMELPIPSSFDSSVRVDNIYVSSSYPNAATTAYGAHSGIHFSPLLTSTTDTPYYALSDGTVTRVESYYTTNQSPAPSGSCSSSGSVVCSWNVNVTFAVSSAQEVIYQFETMAGTPTDQGPLNAQLSALAPGLQSLSTDLHVSLHGGDLVGNLVKLSGVNPILHVGVKWKGTLVCPTSYFSAGSLARANAILQRDQPSWQLCYGD